MSGPLSGSTPAPPARLGGSGAILCPPVPPEGAGTAAPANGPAAGPISPAGTGRNPTPPLPAAGAGRSAGHNTGDRGSRSAFADLMSKAQKNLDEGKLAETHLALSRLYLDPNLDLSLPPEQAKEMLDLLDQLAGTVIYSRQHYLERAYIAQQGDTIDRVARIYEVPWQLLAKINGLMRFDAPNTQRRSRTGR